MRPCGGSKTVQRKLVLLGDGTCGKTSLLNVFTRGFFPTVYEPTVFENYVHDIFVDNIHMELSLWDTAGQDEYDIIRSLSYSDTQAIMICFSVDNRDSLENVESKWLAEINDRCQGVKIVLVALKCDLREEQEKEDDGHKEDKGQTRNDGRKGDYGESDHTSSKKIIQYQEGLEVARKIGALRYLECSGMRNRGVNEAFTEAARVALQVKPAKSMATSSTKCTVM